LLYCAFGVIMESMAYEICSECRLNEVQRGHFICEECEVRLAAAELVPAKDAKKGFLGIAKRPVEPVIVSEEDDPEPLSPWQLLVRGVRLVAVAAVIWCTFVFGWGVFHTQPRVASMNTPPFFQHMQERTRTIVTELTGVLNR